MEKDIVKFEWDAITETQLRFIKLDKQKAEYKKFLEEYHKAVDDVIAEIGLGAYFQDKRDKTVYRTATQDGKFVYFEPNVIQHTKRGDEVKGTVSMKDAKEQGFEV
jgi:hypothetical protein